MNLRTLLLLAALLSSCSHAPAAPSQPQRADRSWIERSNDNAQVLLDVNVKFRPESAARSGISGIDERISDFTPGHRERLRAALRSAVAE